MRVVGVTEYGGPEALRVVEVPDRRAGPGELGIRVRAASVNPTDTYVADGSRAKAQQADPPPYVPGMEVAGILDEIGDGVDTDLVVGDRVMAIVLPKGAHGGYAERVVVPAESVARAPAGSTHAEAATLPMNGLTAVLTLDLLDLGPGHSLAVTGAAGAYGGYVVQLAKAAGLKVIGDAAPADEELVHRLGAHVVVARGDDVADRIRAEVPAGVDALADGAVQNELVVPAIRDGGVLAVVRAWNGETERGITVRPVWVREYLGEQAKLDRLRQQAEAGTLTLRVARTFPMEEAPEAHRLLRAGGIRGRLVLEL